jgi:ATP-dependent helicase HrpB
MSATLDGDSVSDLLGGAPIVTSEGRQFPVETHYREPYQLRDSIVPPVLKAIQYALREQQGSILVFLPGQREINRVARELSARLRQQGQEHVRVEPLYGGLSLERQQQVVSPAPAGMRKVVLSTNLAETSLTIEGISVVVDAGLVREAIFDASTGMTRLTTRRVSRASAEQRQGRAGRQGPGVCYRLWSEQQQQRLVAQATPEILQEDLAPMALQLLSWGVTEPGELAWLDAPPEVAYQQALDILELCGAAFRAEGDRYQLTPHGVRLAQMPLHPRLAHMLLVGCDIHATETACLLAAILSERNPMTDRGVDIANSIAVLMGEERCPQEFQGWFKRTWQQARRFARLATEVHKPRKFALGAAPEDVLGILLASAYPDRIARLRPGEDRTRFQLSNGRSALLPERDDLAGQEWLAVAELGGHTGESQDRIYSATILNPANFSELLSTLVRDHDRVDWDDRNERFVAERHSMVGRILLGVKPLEEVSETARGEALLGVVRRKGLDMLPWTRPLSQWRARIMLLHNTAGGSGDNPWPDLSYECLLATLEDWLLPYLGSVRRLEDFAELDLRSILRALLPWPLPLELERLAPERWAAPSGSSIAIDYEQQPPVLAVKLQEMFGCQETPSVCDGAVPMQVHLLSPAGRPLQITQDLAGFWRSSYQEVRREMRGRYPKHPWPENPLDAQATRHTKRRTGSS